METMSTKTTDVPKYVPQMHGNGPACTGISTFLNLPFIHTLEDVDYVIAGVPFDTQTTFRPGTRFGPDAIRDAYGTVRFSDAFKFEPFKYISGVDYGDVELQNGYPEFSAENIKKTVQEIASHGVIPIMVGGDHSMAYPELLGYKEALGKVAILHFDSHSDTGYSIRDKEQLHDHGTPFKDAIESDCILTGNSVQVGMRGLTSLPYAQNYNFAISHGLTVIKASQLHDMGIYDAAKKIRKILGDAPVFVTFDIDFLDPVYAPGTGTPEGGGFSTWEALELLRCCLIGKNFVGFDLVEVDPQYDSGNKTAQAAKRIISEFCTLIACRKVGITTYYGFGGEKDE